MKGLVALVALGACVLVLVVARPVRAAALHDGRNSLAGDAFVLEDASGRLTVADVRGPAAPRFRRLARDGENAGYTRSVYWLRVQVTNAVASSSFVVELSTTPSIAELYDDTGAVQRSGAALPFGSRPVADANIAFRIELPAGAARTLWIRLQSDDTVLLTVAMWTEAAFWAARAEHGVLNGVYYGVLLGLAAYNLFLFLATRDRGYLLYVAFQLLNGLAQAAIDKYTFQYLWPDHPGWAARSEQVLGCLAMAAALAFARGFLAVRRWSPGLDAAMRALAVAGLGLAAVAAITDADPLNVMIGAHFLASILAIAAAAVVAAARTGARNARVFLVAWAVLLAGTGMAVLSALGIVVSLDGFLLMKLGSAAEAVLLSLALASRINALTRDRERAQRDVLTANAARIEALRRLVSGVAHEVGNPLNFARGGADELGRQLDALERRAPGSDAAARRAYRLVASGLARMKLILDNLRQYLSVGDPEPVATDLAGEIDQALELTGDRLRGAGVRVEQQIDRLPPLRARPGQLHQVMLNLIGNAIDAMPGGGTLRVAVRAGERAVEISVADTGPGVAPADRERVFEPFFTTRADAGGTGLGLAVAREIVMQGGGTIHVEDAAGGGARFVVSLPRLR